VEHTVTHNYVQNIIEPKCAVNITVENIIKENICFQYCYYKHIGIRQKRSSVSQALFWKNECEGVNSFLRQIFKQNLVWRRFGHDYLNKFFEAGVKKRMRRCLRNTKSNVFDLNYITVLRDCDRYLCPGRYNWGPIQAFLPTNACPCVQQDGRLHQSASVAVRLNIQTAETGPRGRILGISPAAAIWSACQGVGHVRLGSEAGKTPFYCYLI